MVVLFRRLRHHLAGGGHLLGDVPRRHEHGPLLGLGGAAVPAAAVRRGAGLRRAVLAVSAGRRLLPVGAAPGGRPPGLVHRLPLPGFGAGLADYRGLPRWLLARPAGDRRAAVGQRPGALRRAAAGAGPGGEPAGDQPAEVLRQCRDRRRGHRLHRYRRAVAAVLPQPSARSAVQRPGRHRRCGRFLPGRRADSAGGGRLGFPRLRRLLADFRGNHRCPRLHSPGDPALDAGGGIHRDAHRLRRDPVLPGHRRGGQRPGGRPGHPGGGGRLRRLGRAALRRSGADRLRRLRGVGADLHRPGDLRHGARRHPARLRPAAPGRPAQGADGGDGLQHAAGQPRPGPGAERHGGRHADRVRQRRFLRGLPDRRRLRSLGPPRRPLGPGQGRLAPGARGAGGERPGSRLAVVRGAQRRLAAGQPRPARRALVPGLGGGRGVLRAGRNWDARRC